MTSAPVILVVEDDPRNAELTRIMLNIAGFPRMLLARSGKEIFEVVEEVPTIDLVLLDIQLPGEDGYQIIGRMREVPKFKQSKIIAITALVMPDDVTKAENLGFDGFLGKPFNFDKFGKQIQRILEGDDLWEPR